ncbi:hypothetical protein BJ170DRAFT_402749 [Xylariales sp. AK1849]|nr:hypothetical protein BJ170DRAFT_402749 [Xylariales sp. AK1849]
MSLNQIRNVVNPWLGGSKGSSTIVGNITSLSSQIAYSERITDNITTLSTNYAPTDGTVAGLLYTPDLDPDDDCYEKASAYIPRNATRQENLPPTNYNLVALAPWIDANCTKSILAATRADQLRAFLFYIPNNDTSQPPAASDPFWSLDDTGDDSWITQYHYPIYVVSGASGSEMMHQLSLYSGNLTQAPHGADISATYNPDSADYIRIWTVLRVSFDSAVLPLWTFLLIIIGVFLLISASTSMLMHCIQNRRRASLRRRVKRGETDLEVLGIKRLTVPPEHILNMPLFTYNYDPPVSPTSPTSPRSPGSLHSAQWRAYATSRANPEKHVPSTDYQPMCHICLEDYESKVTIIRELTCGHIFHPDCIDEFLTEISSLCPICKTSMLPRGYSPKITNGMVRRERATRRLRPRIAAVVDPDLESSQGRSTSWSSTVKKHLYSIPSSPTQPPDYVTELPERVQQANATVTRQRMRELAGPVDDRNSDDGKPQWKRAVTKVFPWP